MNEANSKSKSSEAVPHSPLTYNSYLKVSELKDLQICQSNPPHHDEPLFIIIHQSYELWFKLVLHELDMVFELLSADNVRRSIFYLRRVVAILKLLVDQIHILETMSPKDFLGFRYNLNPASGFQSSQFREIEFAGGLKETRMLEHFRSDPIAYDNLRKRYEQPSLQDAFYDLLRRKGLQLPVAAADASEEEVLRCEEQRVKELLKLYHDKDNYGELHDLAETLVDFDELIFLWRTHHVTVVERIIGFKRGTGGSEGVGYLRTTLVKRCFPDLWKLRTVME
jgi:tryptophan 2,3-dioxygenase